MQRCANCNRTLKALLCCEQPRWLTFFAIPRPWRPCVNLLTWMASLYTPPARVVLALPVAGGFLRAARALASRPRRAFLLWMPTHNELVPAGTFQLCAPG